VCVCVFVEFRVKHLSIQTSGMNLTSEVSLISCIKNCLRLDVIAINTIESVLKK